MTTLERKEEAQHLQADLPALEKECPACDGEGRFVDSMREQDFVNCGLCNGAGLLPTKAGEAILSLFQHNFAAQAQIIRVTLRN